MSAPPPYQNQPPYGHPQQPPYGQPQYGRPQQGYGYPPQQQPYGQPQSPYGQPQPPYGQPQSGHQPPQGPPPPRGPQGPQQPGPVRKLVVYTIAACLIGGLGWYVYDYNRTPADGGASKAEAETRKKNPVEGDCVKINDPDGSPRAEVVDCDSPDAEYRMGERLTGSGQQCAETYDYGIQVDLRRGTDYTQCFTKL